MSFGEDRITYLHNGVNNFMVGKLVEDNFDGSLPSFIAAFAGRKKLSGKEVEEIQEMIARFQKGE